MKKRTRFSSSLFFFVRRYSTYSINPPIFNPFWQLFRWFIENDPKVTYYIFCQLSRKLKKCHPLELRFAEVFLLMTSLCFLFVVMWAIPAIRSRFLFSFLNSILWLYPYASCHMFLCDLTSSNAQNKFNRPSLLSSLILNVPNKIECVRWGCRRHKLFLCHRRPGTNPPRKYANNADG